ncbi:MAG: MGDG synthase family glycosyltransferase [Eubacteriales bacterium]
MGKKVLIFTASTGHGHNIAAESLKKELSFHGYQVLTIEPIKEASKSLDTFIADGYKVLATKLPKMYGTIYKLSNYELTNNKIARLLIKSLEEKIYELSLLHKPSLMISTHPLIVKVISSLIEQSKIDVPFISVITDYQAHQSYISKYVDAYIAGSSYTKENLIEKGIDSEKIYTYGIPIRREFHSKECNLKKDDKFTVLLMGGSMGISAIKKALKNIIAVSYSLKIIVICGNNDTLKKSLENKYESNIGNKIIEILGFTNQIPELMDISDVIITKPGGLTVTESLVKGIPMIIPYYIPGQEKENTEILVNAGVAKSAELKELNEVIETLIEKPQSLKKMRDNIKELTKNHSLDSTVLLAISLIEEYEENSNRSIEEYGR